MTARVLLGLDFETYYDDEYSLRKLSTPAYVLDARFKVHGCAVKNGDRPAVWLDGEKFEKFAGLLNWSKIAVVGHNLQFDGAILSMRYGARPWRYIDTLGMSRFVVGPSVKSHSLGSVYKHLTGLEGKLKSAALAAVKGVRDIPAHLLAELGEYACDDIEQTFTIMKMLGPRFPAGEYRILDWFVRMAVEPTLELDAALLNDVEQEEINKKQGMLDGLASIGVTRESLMSNDKLGKILEQMGVTVPTKVSARTGKTAYDMTKTCKEFTELGRPAPDADDDDEGNLIVQDIVEARLTLKSTIMETRARRLQDMAAVTNNALPVFLNYSGAMQTRRASGGGALNLQNVPRGSTIRKAIKAPKGFVCIVADLANIELRTNLTMAGEDDKVALIRQGVDLYCRFASQIFGMTVSKTDKKERLVGKVGELSLGYCSGAGAYRNMLWAQAKTLVEMPFAQNVVNKYRADKPNLVDMWRNLADALHQMSRGITPANPTLAPFEFKTDGIIGPRGFKIKYPNLRHISVTRVSPVTGQPQTRMQYAYDRFAKDNPSGVDYVHQGVVCNNLNQHIAAEVLNDMVLRFYNLTMLMPALQVHDEIVYVVEEHLADDLLRELLTIMHTAPVWWPELPVAAEGSIAERYGDAK